MTGKARMLLWIVACLLVGGLAARVAAMFETVTGEIKTHPGPEARRNPLLAAHRYLTMRGIASRALDDIAAVPPSRHVLLLAVPDLALPLTLTEELASWVRQGGHLIAAPCEGIGLQGPSLTARRLLESLDVGVECFDYEDEGFVDRGDMPVHVVFSEPQESLVVKAPWVRVADLAGKSEPRTRVAESLERDRGRITILGGTDVFRNEWIRDSDHARLLERLALLGGAPKGVWLVHDTVSPPLLSLVWGWFWPAIVPAGAALALLLWRASIRVGPTLLPPPVGSRSVMDHVAAVGSHLWKRRPEALVAAERQAVLRAVARRRPHLMRHDPLELADILAAAANVSPTVARSAIAGPEPSTRDDFTRAVAALESIRRSV